MNYGLSDETLRMMLAVFAKHPLVEQVILYGSRALDTYRTGSDIDLALTGSTLAYRNVLALHNDLDDLALLYRFDLQNLKTISNPALLDHIRRVGVLLYETPLVAEAGCAQPS